MRRSTLGWLSERSRSASSRTSSPKSSLKTRDKLAHFRTDVAALERHGEVGDHEPRRASAIVALALEPVGVERLLADQLGDRVGELDLAARTGFLRVERSHHVRLQDVAAGQHQG